MVWCLMNSLSLLLMSRVVIFVIFGAAALKFKSICGSGSNSDTDTHSIDKLALEVWVDCALDGEQDVGGNTYTF